MKLSAELRAIVVLMFNKIVVSPADVVMTTFGIPNPIGVTERVVALAVVPEGSCRTRTVFVFNSL
jgi:hypothetical protein